jgi:hypothetical protein
MLPMFNIYGKIYIRIILRRYVMDFTQIKLSEKTSKWLSKLLDADIECINIIDENDELRYMFLEYVKDLLDLKPMAYRNSTRHRIYDKKEKTLEIYPVRYKVKH